MSNELRRVVSIILQRYFGDIVQTVGDDLFRSGGKPLAMIVKTTGLSRGLVSYLKNIYKFRFSQYSLGLVTLSLMLNVNNFFKYPLTHEPFRL